MKIAAIIQARMSSGRLPGKVLLPLAGKPVLWWMTERARLTKQVDQVIVAIPGNEASEPIRDWYYGDERYDHQFILYSYHGEESDVLSRVLSAAHHYGVDAIVDLTADCPCVDPRHIDYLISQFLEESYEYVSNCAVRSWPDGLDAQVYTTAALERVKKDFDPPRHVGWNIGQRPDNFIVGDWPAPKEMHWPELGLTLDTPEDYQLLSVIFDRFGSNPAFRAEEVVEFLRRNPNLLKINQKVRRKAPEEG